MSTLTGNQIKDTYQGLLKLADSSTGITQNLQAIQDGLGNNTGLRITEDQLESPNLLSFIPLKAKYYGSGFLATASQQNAAGTQNIIMAFPFYDKGQYDYSALTVNVISATSTSDTCELAFYSAQMTDNGIYPHQVIMSGITIPTTPAGLNVVSLPSTLSFSGYGGGVFFYVYKISNAGVQPTVRFGAGQNNAGILQSSILGFAKTPALNQYNQAISLNGTPGQVFSGQTTFDNPFASTLPTLQSSTQNIAGTNPGFLLHTIGF